MTFSRTAALATLLLIAGTPRLAVAQNVGGEPGPIDGSVVERGHRVNFGAWFGTGRDLWFGGVSSVRVGPASDTGSTGEAGFGVTAVRARDRLTFGVDARTRVLLDPARSRPWAGDEQASLRMSFRLTRRTSVEAMQYVKYGPIDYFAVPPGLATMGSGESSGAPALSHALPVDHALSSVTDARLTRTMGRRSSLSLAYAFAYRDSVDGQPPRSHSGGARFERRLMTRGTFYAGYRLTTATASGAAAPLLVHDLDSGMAYSRALPFSRRTTVSASTGSSILGDGARRALRLLAAGSISHTLTPGWEARVEYSRPVQYVEGVGTPVLLDSLNVTVGGPTGPRSRLTIQGSSSAGAAGLERADTDVKSQAASARWQTAMSRRLLLHVDAFYARAAFGSQVAMSPLLPRDMQRIGVRALLSYWLPI